MIKIEQCPKCGRIAEGTAVYEGSRLGVKAGVKYAGKKVLVYIVSIILGNFIFPFVGTILGFIIAWIACYFAFSAAEVVADNIVQEVYSSTPFEFSCSHCGTTWKRTYEKGKDITTDAVLGWQKNALTDSFQENAKSSLIVGAICGIIALFCCIYCIIQDSTSTRMTDTYFGGMQEVMVINWTWWLLFIIGIITLLITINRGNYTFKKYEEAETLKKMSISTFRNSPYRNMFSREWLNKTTVPQITVAQSAPKETTTIEKSIEQKKVEYITCPICSEQVEKGLRVCPYCNEVISDSSPSIAPVQPQPEQKTTVEEPETIKGEMMRCPICCELIPANSQVCPECNEQIGTSSVENKTEERDYYLYDVDISHLQTKEKVQKYGCSEATTQMVITEKDENKTAIDPSCRSVTIYGSYKSAPNAEYIDIEVKLFTNQEVRQYVGSYYYNDIELKYLDNSTLYLYENMPHKYVEAE